MIYRPNDSTYEQRLLARIAIENDEFALGILQEQLKQERFESSQIQSGPPCDMSCVYNDELPPY
jgi:hypothetical protein